MILTNKLNIKQVFIYIFIIIIILLTLFNYKKIPSKEEHINRNKYNIMPVGKLTNINNINNKNNQYIDENGVIWLKRSFIKSLAHNPFKNYVFETDLNKNNNIVSSSEVEANKELFDSGKQVFRPATFNYYSSFYYPISHFFADMLPSLIYLFPNYNKFQ